MKLWPKIAAFFLGGWLYVALELLWRRRSHPSMFAASGLSLALIGFLREKCPRFSLPLRLISGAGIITALELITGLLVNRDHTVWDYRCLPGNFHGQICPQFCLLWIPMAWIADRIYRMLVKCFDPL